MGLFLKAFCAAAAIALSGCASLQRKCAKAPWLLCGDRITIHKDYVYMDDPAFLYNNKTVVDKSGGEYRFRLSLFFNPYRFKALTLTSEIRSNQAAAAAPSECKIENAQAGKDNREESQVFASLDSVFFSSANERKDRINLRFVCKDYKPKWGREDTLALRFASGARGSADSVSTLMLPFATSFHGPVYSFAIGSFLILSMTAIGEFLATNK